MGDLTESVKGITLGEVYGILFFVTLFVGVIITVVNWAQKPSKENAAEHKRIEKTVEEKIAETNKQLEEKILDIKNLLNDLSEFVKKINEENKETNALMIRARIKEWYLKYTARGWISVDELAIFKELLDEYWELGYNHLSKQYLKDVEKLTIKPYGHD